MEEKQLNTTMPPAYIINNARLNRLNRIIYNMAVSTGVLTFFALLAGIITPLLYFATILFLFIAIIIMVVFTLGTVFAMPFNPVGHLWSALQSITSANDSILNLSKIAVNCTKWISLAGIILSIISIVLISINERKSKVLKIVLLSILILIMVVIFLFQILTGGVQWQG